MNKVVQQGSHAFRKGDLINPYKSGSNKHRQWQYGFDQAYFRNLEEVLKSERQRKSPS